MTKPQESMRFAFAFMAASLHPHFAYALAAVCVVVALAQIVHQRRAGQNDR